MSSRLRIWLLIGWAVAVVAVLALNLLFPPPGLENAWQWVGGMMTFPIAAAVILGRRPGNGVGLTFFVVGTATVVNFVLYWLATTNPSSSLAPLAEVISGAAVMPMFSGIIAVLYLFPTGATLGAWHAKVLTALWVVTALGVALFLLAPGSIVETGQANPFAILPAWADGLVEDGFRLLPLFAAIGVVSLVVRWRRAGQVEKAQLRWFLAAATLFFLMLVMISVSGDEEEAGLAFILSSVFVIVAFWAIPAAIVVAILRYRLFEIDRLISRTVSYALVVAVLAGLFAAVAIGLPQILSLPEESSLLVAGATLAVAALFNPLRRRVQSAVDRRFNRGRYDAEQEVSRFAEHLRDHVDLDEMTVEMMGVLGRTIQPASAAVWIRDR